MSTYTSDSSWDDFSDGLHKTPLATTSQDHSSDEIDIVDAIGANEAAGARRTWYDKQSDRDLRKFAVERGIIVPISRQESSSEGIIDAIMDQYMKSAIRDAARGKKEVAKRRAWYDEQSDDELWQIIAQRKLELPMSHSCSPQPLRKKVIDAFMAQDKELQFPFMRLPAELRNRVYSYLLIDQAQQTEVVEKPRISCYPNILAVSKLINKEAWNILYANAYVTINLVFHQVVAHLKIDCIKPTARGNSSSRSGSPITDTQSHALPFGQLSQPTSSNQIAPNGQPAPNGQLGLNGQQQTLSNLAQQSAFVSNHAQQMFALHALQLPPIFTYNAIPDPPPTDPPTGTRCDMRRAASNLHKEVISKVGHVNICIVIAHPSVLESELRTAELRQIVTELKSYMAKHAGREQTVSVMLDLVWENTGSGTSAAYKKNPANKQHIHNDVIKILEPFSRIAEMKEYGHLAACQKMEVIFRVTGDISAEVGVTLEGKKQEVEKTAEEKKLGPATIECLLRTPAQQLQDEIDSRVTENIFKKHWREDTWEQESENEDGEGHSYTLSPKKKDRTDDLWDADLGKDDDSVNFDTDDDDEDGELFDQEDLDDGDYDLDDLIVEATPAAEPVAFHPELEKNREVKEWLKNGGFKSELNNLREARVIALDKKNGSDRQGHSILGND